MAADPNRTARRKLFSTHNRRAGSFAMIQPQRAVTMSSAALQTVGERKQSPAGSQRPSADLEWQRRAYELSDELGELGYLLNLKANVVSRCNLNPQQWDGGQWENTIDERVLRVHDSFVGPYGGQQELKRRAGLQLSTAGETYLLGTPLSDGSPGSPPDAQRYGIVWEFLSTEELRLQPGRPVERRRDGYTVEAIPVEAYMARCWRAHSRFCVDEATEALTADGWKRFDQIEAGDELLTLNHATGQSEWQPALAVSSFPVVDEPMLAMEGNSHSSLTTLDHRWPVIKMHTDNRAWSTSETLTSTDTIPTAAPCADLPTAAKHSDALVELVAWYWTEGSARGSTISQSLKANPHHVEAIRACLTTLFGPSIDRDMRGLRRRPPANCSFPDCGWPTWARGLCKAHDMQRRGGGELKVVRRQSPRPQRDTSLVGWREHLDRKKGMVSFILSEGAAEELLRIAPRRQVDLAFIRQLTRAQLELFISKSLDADGHRVRSTKAGPDFASITQKSREMLHAFELACILAGYQPRTSCRSIRHLQGPLEGREFPIWHVSVCRHTRLYVDRARRRTTYTGTVWCPTTANGTWMARRNGKTYFTGNSEWADSEVRRVRSIAEEILTLTQMTEAIAKSKIAAGMLFIPDSMSVTGSDESDDADGGENQDGLDPATRVVMKHMVTPTQNRRSAASLVPLVIVGPAEEGQHIRLIDLARSLDTYGQELRQEALSRLAQGLDSPPELLTGKMNLNHWTGWNIDSDFIVKHVAPLGDLLAQFLTIAYLRPMLMLFEGVNADEANQFRYEFDLSPVSARADAAASAQALHPMEVLSDDTLLKANGFDESDKPDAQELFIRRALRLINSNPLALGPALINLVPGFEHVDLTKIPSGAPSAGPTGSPTPLQPGQPSGDTQPPQPAPAAIRALHMQLQTACDMALERALERAGGKIINAASKNIAIRDRLRSVPKLQVVSMVTPEELREVGVVRNERLLEGAWDGLQRRAVPWIRSYLVHLGWNEYKADDSAALAASALCEAMNAYVVEHFHDGFPVLAGGMRTPDPIVLGALTPLLECVA